ncbi:MAG: hypothetical protein KJ579_10505 [Verrucomicrobia bacterium]|nr:hypothetical protein [Verrucomicrobiota bacterium]
MKHSEWAVVAAAAVVWACGSGCATLQERMSGVQYKEMTHEGRVYVLGKAETIKKSATKPEVAYTTTKIGAGPGGVTVILEADPKDDLLSKKLWQLYTCRHGVRR